MLRRILAAAAALYGSLFFGIESPGARSFLLQLPISRGRLLAAKVAAAAVHFAVLWVFSTLIFRILRPLPEGFVESWKAPLLLALVAYGVCAWLSTWTREAMAALFLGPLALSLGYAALEGLVPEVPRWAWTSLALTLIAACAWGLWRRLAAMEDRPDHTASRGPLAPGGWSGGHLLGIEWRQKRLVMGLLLALPALSAAVSWQGSGPFILFLWAPVAGAVLGTLLWTEPERDGVAFFVHHLPITRSRMVAGRLAAGLVIGGILVAQYLAAMWLFVLRHPSFPEHLRPTATPMVYYFALLYVVAFGLGATLSPWLRSTILGTVLVLLTVLAIVLVPGLFEEGVIPYGWHLALVAAVSGLAWWSSVHSRAFEPMPGKNLRPLWLLAPFWVLLLASHLV